MSVLLKLACSGCDASAEVGPLYHGQHPEALTPDGWVMFDPWTRVTYCPACWQSITAL